jgi:hypothetical protein
MREGEALTRVKHRPATKPKTGFLSYQQVSSLEEDVADVARERVAQLMNTLPLSGVVELLHRAKELSQKYNAQPAKEQSKLQA